MGKSRDRMDVWMEEIELMDVKQPTWIDKLVSAVFQLVVYLSSLTAQTGKPSSESRVR